MPPKRKSAAVARPPLPAPNATHPCASLLPTVLNPTSLNERPHPASYHAFLTSLYYPKISSDSEPPTKKRKKDSSQPKLPPALDTAIQAVIVQQKLLAWFDGVKEKRGMPWRKEVDPKTLPQKERTQRGYEVWVSEVMLQQTQVATVIPYWKKWMEKFPTVEALAKADIEEVNEVWKGLGYYSRAKRLLDGAKTVVDKHDAILPETAEGLLDIDGIGPYSAGSISSIAFAQRSPMVDGNVSRVLSRLTAFHAPASAKATTSYIWALADVLVPLQPTKKEASQDGESSTLDIGGLNKPGAWNQALMELGATVCTPKNPNCAECPLNDECLAYAEARYVAHHPADGSATAPPDIEDLCTLCAPLPYGDASEARQHDVEVYPMAKEKTKKRDEETAVRVLEWVPSGADEKSEEGRKVLLIKRPEKGLLAGLYEFPAVDLPTSTASSTAKARSRYLDKLLHTLLDVPSSTTFGASSLEDTDASNLRILSRSTLPPVTHVYSHMNRTYHSERLVISSPSLPILRKSLTSPPAKNDDVVQSLPGRGKWVDVTAVEGENVGGAVGKVWEERQLQAKGLASTNGAKGKGKGKGKAGEGAKKAKVEKGQGSLSGFFVKKEKRVEETIEADDELIVVEEKREVKVASKNGGSTKNHAEQETKIYKKRRIAPSSEDEDE
ncbi:A/G-specific adenine DNA glycosylase [Rhodotorula toruloides]|uniref:Adenine DNA glycosylase n=1 Tax=Rhodotorula toruloides TaxID=5286 RepID=A0A511KBT0_RHOTO|nr:A/G-specific adenine DNA glycosylase [Rhodotorula toruloides]